MAAHEAPPSLGFSRQEHWITTNCGEFFKRWEYQTSWPASWEIYMQVKKQVRTGNGTKDRFQIRKGVHQGCILSPCLFNLYAEWVSEWVKSLSRVWLFATPWTVAHQALPSMGFSKQEYWSGLPFPSPGDLPDPEIKLVSPAFQADALTSEPPGKLVKVCRLRHVKCRAGWSTSWNQDYWEKYK